jgi:hypothetical protein
LATRKVQTEVELENGQSFAIAGLLDNRVTSTLNKIPGISEIPVLGKLFESRSLQKNNSELLVVITPVLVRPTEAGGKGPDLEMPKAPMKGIPNVVPQQPAVPTSDPFSHLPRTDKIPVELTPGFNGGSTSADVPSGPKNPGADLKPLFTLTPGTNADVPPTGQNPALSPAISQTKR